MNKGDIKTELNVKFFCSATLELISSLHVLSEPGHHKSCHSWHEITVQEIDPTLLARIKAFGKKYVNWSFIMDIIDYLVIDEASEVSIKDDFDLICKRLDDLDDENFIYIFLGETLLGEKSIARKIMEDIESIDDLDLSKLYPFIKKKDVVHFIINYKSVKAELMEIMMDYHTSIFATLWDVLKTHYWGKIQNERKRLEVMTPLHFILSLNKNLVYDNNKLILRREPDLSLPGDSIQEIRLFFSMFTFPHLMVTVYDDETISIYENLIFPQITKENEALASAMKAFSDVNRLMILRLLSESSITNKEMSELLSISPASISQHLKLLKEIGMIMSVRKKNTIYYSLKNDVVQDVLGNLNQYLSL